MDFVFGIYVIHFAESISMVISKLVEKLKIYVTNQTKSYVILWIPPILINLKRRHIKKIKTLFKLILFD